MKKVNSNNPFTINSTDSLEKKLFYFFFIIAELFCIVATFASFFEQISIALNIACIICTLIPPIIFVICNSRKDYTNGQLFLTICVNCLMIPAAYFLSGGIHSGVPIIFFAGEVCCATCSKSIHRMVTFCCSTICHCICIVVEIEFPSLIAKMSTASLTMDIVISLFLASVAVYYYISILIETHENDTKIKISELNRRNALYQNVLEQQNENVEEIKKARHDVRHHNLILLEYLENNQSDKALDYLKEKIKRDEFYEKKIYCMNSVLDSIFNYAERNCRKNNISFHVHADVTNELPILANDLTAIFANVVENAVHGALGSKKENKEISIKTFCKSEKLVFTCTNTCTDSMIIYNGLPKNKSIGISSIVDSVNSYDGNIDYTFDGDKITCTIILNFKK